MTLVGQNATGSGPTDSFTGGTNGWNVAILPDALSNYTITTLNGVTAPFTNATGDPAHRGTLNVTNVWELVFNPSADPSSNDGVLEAFAGSAVALVGPLPNTQ